MDRHRWWWTTAALIVIVPVVADIVSGASSRDTVLVNVSVALGLVATSALVLVFAPVSRLKGLSRVLGLRDSHDLHKLLGVSITALVMIHMVVALLTVPQGIGLLNVFDTTNAARGAVVSTVALLLLTTLVLPRVGKQRYVLRLRLHALLAGVATLGAGAHILLLFRLVSDPVMAGVFAGLAVLTLACLSQRWVLRPLAGRGSYVVYGVRAENPLVSTLVLAPVHLRRRLRFEPGQFVWLRLRRFPVADEHPFSIASSAANGRRVELTIRAGGEFSTMVSRLERGRPVWLDGPYGDLVPTPEPDAPPPPTRPTTGPRAWTRPEDVEAPDSRDAVPDGLVCIAGGVGVTPIIGMLRSLSDAGDSRPIRVLLAERDGEELFPREFAALERQLDLQVVRTGGRRVGVELISEVLPAGARARWEYLLCGSGSLTDAAVAALTDCGVPESRIRTERFG